MNIFVVDDNPVVAAMSLCDRHVVKMVLETAQILSTVLPSAEMYRPTHKNHPCTLWAAESPHNTRWLIAHGQALGHEYTYRYGKVHASSAVIERARIKFGYGGKWRLHTPFVQVVPEQYRQDSAVGAYRAYYCAEKKAFATWKSPSTPPEWFA